MYTFKQVTTDWNIKKNSVCIPHKMLQVLEDTVVTAFENCLILLGNRYILRFAIDFLTVLHFLPDKKIPCSQLYDLKPPYPQ